MFEAEGKAVGQVSQNFQKLLEPVGTAQDPASLASNVKVSSHAGTV